MGKYAPTKLLALVELFEVKAKRPIPNRILALAALTEMEEGKALQFSVSTLGLGIKKLIGIKPSIEEWANWMDLNKTVLDKLVLYGWRYSSFPDNFVTSVIDQKSTGNSIEAFISKDNLPPSDEFVMRAQHLLSGVGPIPNLYVKVGFVTKYQEAVPPPDLAHDVWLIDVLKQFFWLGESSKDFPAISKFVEENKPTLRKIRSMFATTAPKYLGGGVDGMAFDIGEGKVLKIFRSRAAFVKTQRAIERLHKNPELSKTEAMIYDIGQFTPIDVRGYKATLYYYIIEKMRPVADLPVRDQIDDLYHTILNKLQLNYPEKWKYMRDKVKDPSKHAEVKKEVEQMAKEQAAQLRSAKDEDLREIENNIALSSDWLESFVEELIMKIITYRTDLHMGNLGVTHYGKLRYFDPTYAQSGSEII